MCDMMNDSIADWKTMGMGFFEFSLNGHEPSEEQKATLAKANAKYLPMLERQLAKTGTGFFVGDKFSYADYAAFECLEEIAPYEDL